MSSYYHSDVRPELVREWSGVTISEPDYLEFIRQTEAALAAGALGVNSVAPPLDLNGGFSFQGEVIFPATAGMEELPGLTATDLPVLGGGVYRRYMDEHTGAEALEPLEGDVVVHARRIRSIRGFLTGEPRLKLAVWKAPFSEP